MDSISLDLGQSLNCNRSSPLGLADERFGGKRMVAVAWLLIFLIGIFPQCTHFLIGMGPRAVETPRAKKLISIALAVSGAVAFLCLLPYLESGSGASSGADELQASDIWVRISLVASTTFIFFPRVVQGLGSIYPSLDWLTWSEE